jgi:hypothetical protein
MPFQSWTFNQLMSVVIRQEDAIRATKEEKRGKSTSPGPPGGRFAQVSLSLHSAYRPATWSSAAAAAVGLPYTPAGSSTFANSPIAVCSTLSSADCRAGLLVLQLRAPWALCLGLSPTTIGLLSKDSDATRESSEGAHPSSYTLKLDRENYTIVEEIPTGEEVLTSTYYLCEHTIVILFDSGASHYFMSLACAQKTNLSLKKTEVSYLIFTPGGRVVANRMVRKIPLELAGQIFPTNLLILEGQGIDIILRMIRMKMHKALLDVYAHLVHLDSPASGKVTLHLPVVPRLQAFVHATIA